MREEMNLEVAIEFSDFNFRSGNNICDNIGFGLGDEECDRLVDQELHLALLGGSLRVVEELNEVAGIDLNTLSTFMSDFIKRLTDTTAIIVQKTPVLHDFDDAVRKDSATLRAVVHDSELHVCGWATDGQGGVDGVVVGRSKLISDQGPVRSLVQDTGLHLKAIRISVEGLLIVEILIDHGPSHNNLFSEVIIFSDRDSMHLNLPLNGGGTRDETNQSSVKIRPFRVLEVQIEGLDASASAQESILAIVGRVHLLVHVTFLWLEDVGTTSDIVRVFEIIIACGRIVVLESEFHIARDVIGKVSDTEESLLGDYKATWLLEFNPEVLILNNSLFRFWSLDSGAQSSGIHSFDFEVCEVLGLDLSLNVKITRLVGISLLRILSAFEADQV